MKNIAKLTTDVKPNLLIISLGFLLALCVNSYAQSAVTISNTVPATGTALPAWSYYFMASFTTTQSAKCEISQNAAYSNNDPTTVYDVIPNFNSPNLTYDSNLNFNNANTIPPFYSTSSTYGYGTSHYFPIIGLSFGQSYTYYAHCQSTSGAFNPGTAASALTTFTVASAPSTAANIDSLINTFVYFDAAVIQWNTDRPTDMTTFEYSTDPNFSPQNTITLPRDYALSIAHGVTLTGLSPGTTYYYQFTDTDSNSVMS